MAIPLSCHPIRLRGPWEVLPLHSTGKQPPASDAFVPLRQQLPADWGPLLGNDFRGVVRYTRSCGLPTNLEAREQVWLVCDGVDATAKLHWNGAALGELSTPLTRGEWNVTARLLPRNELIIDVTCPADDDPAAVLRGDARGKPGGLVGEVRLEIRAVP